MPAGLVPIAAVQIVAAVVESSPSLALTHAPGHMLVTDARDTDLLLA